MTVAVTGALSGCDRGGGRDLPAPLAGAGIFRVDLPMVSPVLLDTAILTLWQRLQTVAAEGVRTWRRWTPVDGMPFAPPAPAHQHTTPTLVLGLSGTVRLRGATAVDLLPGDALLIEPGCWHDHAVHEPGSSSLVLGFLGERCEVLLFDHDKTLWGCVADEPYRGILDLLLADPAEAERMRLTEELLTQVRRDRIEFANWIESGVQQMAGWLWNHLHETIDAESIVAQSGMGRTAAYEKFRGFFGRSPKQELLSRRLNLARHLLRRGFAVTECARRCGFPNRAELTRAFRRRFGHPPSADAQRLRISP